MAVCGASEPGKITREVFPVPSVIAGIFKSGGLPAFDPFTMWERGSAKPPTFLSPAAAGADAGLLPPGLLYDVLPVWKARGFQPRNGTGVLYHPGSRLLFAAIATGDEEEVRAYCQWPAELWLGDDHWRGSPPHQLQARVSVWAVPATGPGGWQFQPENPEELMALPTDARRLAGRQTFAIRSGQSSHAEAITGPRLTNNGTGPGLLTDMECTLADDGESVDFNGEINWLTGQGKGRLSETRISFQHLSKLGGEWLVEGGCLQGTPPERIFFVFASYRVEQDAVAVNLEKVVPKWTGQPQAATISVDGLSGLVLDSFEMEILAQNRQRVSLQRNGKTDPDLLPSGQSADPLPGLDGKGVPATTVPGLFGESKVLEITPVLSGFFGLAPGDIQAWVLEPGLFVNRYIFVRGKPAVLEEIGKQTTLLDSRPDSNQPVTLTADITISRAMPGAPLEGEEIIWHGRIPIRSGQASFMKNSAGTDAREEAESGAGGWNLKIGTPSILGAPANTPQEPATPDSWNLEISGSLGPPLVDSRVDMPVLTAAGTPEGASLRRIVGKQADGREVILAVRLTPDTPEKAGRRNGSRPVDAGLSFGHMAWWWRQQVAKAGAP